MSLQFIMGPSGSGKSHYLYEQITKESLAHPEKNYIVLVPEQFTMQTQKDLVMASPRKGILNVDVLSFNRLAHRIFEETGENKRAVLDDVGKNFVIRKIAGEKEGELCVLGSNLKKTGYISEMKSLLSEFTQYDVQGEQLDEMIAAAGPETSLYYKLQDIRTIYEGFQGFLQDRYITAEEILEILASVVTKSKILKDSVIVLDGFTGFTPVQHKLLRELMRVCEKIIVTVTMDRRENPYVYKHPYQLFAMSKQMVTSLIELAKELRVEIEEPVCLYEKPVYRFRKNEPLSFLQEHVFRYSKEQYEEEQDAIQIYCGKNPQEEVKFVAQKIRGLVRKKGYQYREIAVIASDMETYAGFVEREFATYEIPVFMDYKRSILLNSFVEYIRSLLAMAEQNFSYESVFRYLRTDLSGLTRTEVDQLENYVLALGIKGYQKWKDKWIRRTKQMGEEELSHINEIKDKFLANIEEVMEVLKRRHKTVLDITKALHTFFVQEKLQERVQEYEKQFAAAGELALEKEYAQVYRIVIELLDQFVALLGEERISMKEYCNLLDAGLEEAKVGIIPPTIDQIVIGDVQRTRVKDVKVLFLLGVNDVHIPGSVQNKGLLSEHDRKKFAEHGTELAPGTKEKTFIQKFYLYLMMTKPSAQLYLTYCKASSDGTAIRPSYLIADLRKLYPKMKVQTIESDFLGQEWTAVSGISYLVKGLQQRADGMNTMWQELYSWYKRNPEWCEKIEQIVEAAFYHKPNTALTRETARALYGDILENSVTRLEKFSACAYAHFLSYGLKLQEREIYQFKPVDLGTLFHSAIEKYAGKLEREGVTWTTVSKELQKALMEESVEECVTDYGNSILYSNARNEYVIERLKRMLARTIWALTKQLERGAFVPSNFEMKFKNEIALEELGQMRLRGKIDRIDIYEDADKVAVKVIDYKTGIKSFELGELFYGLQMQLVVYMNAAIQREQEKHPEKRIIPAGLFYYRMKDPVIARPDAEEEIEDLLLKELRLDGYVQAEEEVLELFDRFTGASKIIPVGKTKTGALTKASKVLLEQDFESISNYTKAKVKRIGKQILNGENDIAPYTMGTDTGCDYCPYQSICRFDEKVPGYEQRTLKKLSAQEALNEMKREEA